MKHLTCCLKVVAERRILVILSVFVIAVLVGCSGLPYKPEWIIPTELSTYPLLEGVYLVCNEDTSKCENTKGKHVYVNLASNYYEITSDDDRYSDSVAGIRLYPISMKTTDVQRIGSRMITVKDIYIVQQILIKNNGLGEDVTKSNGDIVFLQFLPTNTTDDAPEFAIYVPKCQNTSMANIGDGNSAKKSQKAQEKENLIDVNNTKTQWNNLIREFGKLVELTIDQQITTDDKGRDITEVGPDGRKHANVNCSAVDLQRTITLGNVLFTSSLGYGDLLIKVREYRLQMAAEPRVPHRTFE